MRLKRRIFGVFAAALAGVLLCGCTAAEGMQEHRTETPITIKVGSDNYPPFNYTDENGNPAGVDVDLAKESFGRLGYAVSLRSALTGKKRRNWLNMVILTVSGDVFPLMGARTNTTGLNRI